MNCTVESPQFDCSVVFYLKLGSFLFGVFVQKWLFTSIQVLISVNIRQTM